MTMRGTQISMFIMLMVGFIAALVGVLIGSSAGFFRGKTEAVLMRFTDMIIIIPALIAAAVVANSAKSVVALAAFLGLVSWTGMARLVRGDFLTLREREFVDAARLAGASNQRIIFKHILPNAVGVITVNTTLLMSAAILTETALSYVGLGVKSPDVSLGSLISANQAAFATRPWLFWWPGVFIVVICLTINFIGDGLRDAFDPRQKKLALRRVKETRDRTAAGVMYKPGAAPDHISSAGSDSIASGGLVRVVRPASRHGRRERRRAGAGGDVRSEPRPRRRQPPDRAARSPRRSSAASTGVSSATPMGSSSFSTSSSQRRRTMRGDVAGRRAGQVADGDRAAGVAGHAGHPGELLVAGGHHLVAARPGCRPGAVAAGRGHQGQRVLRLDVDERGPRHPDGAQRVHQRDALVA